MVNTYLYVVAHVLCNKNSEYALDWTTGDIPTLQHIHNTIVKCVLI